MATLTIRKIDGSQAGSLDLNDAVFAVEPNVYCVRAAVDQFLADQRAGTHATKTRGFVSGGGRKPWRQKGTGRARQGSIRATQWRGGAIIFGPQPRSYAHKVPRKVKQNAYRSIWSELVSSNKLVVVEEFAFDKPRTSRMVRIFENLGLEGRILFVTAASDDNVLLSVRNLQWVTPLRVENLNVYDLLTHDWVVVTPEVLKYVEENYA